MKSTMLLGMMALTLGITASAQTDTMMKMGTDSMSMGNNGTESTDKTYGSTLSKTDRIGKTTVAAFNSLNAKGSKMVSAITPTDAALSAIDKQLLLKVAAGGQRQLAISQAVLDNVTNPQVQLLAASEVEEQTGVSAKLKEIAAAKNVTLPEGPDKATQALVTRIQAMSGNALDAMYINESGVKGHELLQATMTTVNASAKDEALKALATATMPVIRMHLNVSRDIQGMMKSGKTGKAAMK